MKGEKIKVTLLHTTNGRRYVFTDELTWCSSKVTIKQIIEVYNKDESSVCPRFLSTERDSRKIINIDFKDLPNEVSIPINSIDSIEFYIVDKSSIM